MVTLRTTPTKTAAPRTDGRRQGTWLEIVASRETLETYLDAWNDLAANALEVNVFYEPAMLLPALTHLSSGHDVVIVLMLRSVRGRKEPELMALFPLRRTRGYLGLPIRKMLLWAYDHCYLTTPLIRKGCGRESWTALFDWMKADPQAGAILEQRFFPGEGPVYQELVELVRRRALLTFELERATRSYFRLRTTAASYLEQSLSPSRRRDLKRTWRRLEELGTVDIRTLNNADELPKWIGDFLRIEKSGWKGKEGTALGSSPHGAAYFTDACTRLLEEGRLDMAGLFLNGLPIAVRCKILAEPGAFCFKPAYNEEYGKYSLGVHLEVEHIRQLHDHRAVNWMDSCTSPDNTLLNELWLDRRCVLALQIATKGRVAPFLLGAVRPVLRWVNRSLGRNRTVAH